MTKKKWDEVISLEQQAVEFSPNDQTHAASLELLAKAKAKAGHVVEACNLLDQAYNLQESQNILQEMKELRCSEES